MHKIRHLFKLGVDIINLYQHLFINLFILLFILCSVQSKQRIESKITKLKLATETVPKMNLTPNGDLVINFLKRIAVQKPQSLITTQVGYEDSSCNFFLNLSGPRLDEAYNYIYSISNTRPRLHILSANSNKENGTGSGEYGFSQNSNGQKGQVRAFVLEYLKKEKMENIDSIKSRSMLKGTQVKSDNISNYEIQIRLSACN